MMEIREYYRIPIPTSPNEEYELTLPDFSLNVRFKQIEDRWLLWVLKDGFPIINGCQIHNKIILNRVTQEQLGGVIFANFRGEGRINSSSRDYLEIVCGLF